MKPIPTRRRRPALAPLALAGLWTLLSAPAFTPSALAGDQGVTRSQVAGHPRCSDSPPASIAQPPAGHGEPNDADGTTYDTNWIFDGGSGDSDIVWLQVEKANIQGYGNAEDADPSSGTSRRGSAWGEDSLVFTVAGTSTQPGTIVVTNQISISAEWVVEGTGVNHVVLYSEALDILGTVHVFKQVISVDARLGASMTDGSSSTDQSWEKSASGGEGESSTTTDSSGSRTTTTDSDSIERRVESSTTNSGAAQANWTVERRAHDRSCTVRIASTELIGVKAQAMVDDVQTRAEVQRFDTVNIVEARYVLDADPDGGTGTPGGEDGKSPGTPGGGDGTPPGATTPSEPAPTPVKPVPTEPAPVLPSDPSLPPEPKLPPEPTIPGGGAVPPSGGTDVPGTDVPGTDGTGGGSGGGSATDDPDGTAPAGGGTDLGGSAPASGDGGVAPPAGDGSAPVPSGDDPDSGFPGIEIPDGSGGGDGNGAGAGGSLGGTGGGSLIP